MPSASHQHFSSSAYFQNRILTLTYYKVLYEVSTCGSLLLPFTASSPSYSILPCYGHTVSSPSSDAPQAPALLFAGPSALGALMTGFCNLSKALLESCSLREAFPDFPHLNDKPDLLCSDLQPLLWFP
jgi:hypothetical protein